MIRVISFLFCMLPAILQAQELPDYESYLVNDFADILSPETEATLSNMLSEARNTRDHEMTVVTINKRSDYGDHQSIERFAKDLFNKWGISNAERNDGILLLVAVEDREMRIALGSGYPARFDGLATRIIERDILPDFRAGRMERGIVAGTAASLEVLRLDRDSAGLSGETYEDRYTTTWFERLTGWLPDDPLALILGAPLALIAAFFGGRWGLRNRPRKCPECGRVMLRLGDKQEDQYLDQGELIEERIASKDYGVWICEHDEHVTVIGYPKMFSRHKACPSCGYKAYETKRKVIFAPTKTATGQAELHHHCTNCGHAAKEMVTIPVVSESSGSGLGGSSSGGGGGGFGGGSSGGGGGSGSW